MQVAAWSTALCFLARACTFGVWCSTLKGAWSWGYIGGFSAHLLVWTSQRAWVSLCLISRPYLAVVSCKMENTGSLGNYTVKYLISLDSSRVVVLGAQLDCGCLKKDVGVLGAWSLLSLFGILAKSCLLFSSFLSHTQEYSKVFSLPP